MARAAMARAAKDAVLYLRVTAEDVARLDALAAKIPLATRAALGRAAMLIGLEQIERDPTVLVAGAKPGG